jgi:hypothetical protein
MAVAIWAACAGAYVLGAVNTNSCPPGSSKIGTTAACESAAVTVGVTHGGSDSNLNSPSGCFMNIAAHPYRVNLNTAVPGAADAYAQPLCAGARRPDPAHTLRTARARRVCGCLHACSRVCACVYVCVHTHERM